MGTLTAFIFVGTSHPNHGGINPTHYMTLSENSRPCLELRSFDDNKEIVRIIPTIENTIDDIHFIIHSFVLKKNTSNQDFNFKEMYELFSDDERKLLYEEVKTGLKDINMKIVYNLLDGSVLLGQTNKIKEYPTKY